MKKTVDTVKKPGNFIITLFLNSLLGVLITLLLCLISALLVSSEIITPGLIPTFSGIAVFVGTFMAGLFSARKLGHPIYIALAQGSFFLLTLYLIGVTLSGHIIPESNLLAVPLLSFIGAICGAIISAIFPSGKR